MPLHTWTYRSILTFSLVLLMAGCGSEEGSHEFETSARWHAELEWSIGGVQDSELALARVGSMALASDGTLYAWLPTEAAVLSVDSLGRPGRRLGRRGEGPGEFSDLVRIGTVADTLYALDTRLSRITYLDRSGRVLRTQQVLPPDVPDGFFPGPLATLMPGETLGMMLSYPAHLVAEGRIEASPILRVDTEGNVVARLALVSQLGFQATVGGGEQGAFFTGQPLADNPLTGFAPDGSGLVVVNRRAPRSKDGAQVEVIRISPVGDTLTQRSYRYRPEPVPSGFPDSVLDAMWESFGGRNAPFTRPQLQEAVDFPQYFPPVEALVVGVDGKLWLGRWSTANHDQDWVILGSNGEVEGTVALPGRFMPRIAQADRVWGVELDSLDVPQVMRYRVTIRE